MVNPLFVAIDVSQVAAPGFPVTIIVCEPFAVPKDVNRLLRASVDRLQSDIEKPTVMFGKINSCKEPQLLNVEVVFETLVQSEKTILFKFQQLEKV